MSEESPQAGPSNGRDGFAEGPEGDTPMSFFDHMTELRKRLMWTVAALVVGFFACFTFASPIEQFLRGPLDDAWRNAGHVERLELQYLNLQDTLVVDFRVAFMAAIFLSLPVIFYQLWMFISPGLYAREKRFVIPFVVVSAMMFVAGAAFAFYFVIPFIYEFFITYGQEKGEAIRPEPSGYYKGTTRILLAFGSVFEFPLLVAFLAKFEMVTERTLLKFWRFAMLVIFVLAAFLTPPEPISQLMMAGPMVLLYFLSVGVAWMINPASKHADHSADDESAPPSVPE